MKSARGRRGPGPLLVVPAAVWLVVFGVAPFYLLVALSFWTSTIFRTTPDLTRQHRVLAEDLIYLWILLRTLRIAAMVTVISLLASYMGPAVRRRVQVEGLGELISDASNTDGLPELQVGAPVVIRWGDGPSVLTE